MGDIDGADAAPPGLMIAIPRMGNGSGRPLDDKPSKAYATVWV